MIDDPYKVLGLSPGASAEEIKKAYRKKAKEYHPDLHPDDPTAAQKMNEINEAYDMLQHPEKYKARREQEAKKQQENARYSGYGGQTGYGGSSGNGYGSWDGRQSGGSQDRGYQNYGGWTSDFGGFDFGDLFGFGPARYNTAPQPQAGDPPELVRAIRAVQSGRFGEAIDILSRMTSQYRNDRWYYVSAAAYKGSGETARAQDMIERAIQMNTGNQMYRQYRQEILQEARSETGSYYSGSSVSPFGFFWKFMIGLMLFRMVMTFLQMLLFGLPFRF